MAALLALLQLSIRHKFTCNIMFSYAQSR